jgi:hypothetical protein
MVTSLNDLTRLGAEVITKLYKLWTAIADGADPTNVH